MVDKQKTPSPISNYISILMTFGLWEKMFQDVCVTMVIYILGYTSSWD